jgi:hypothetical protein
MHSKSRAVHIPTCRKGSHLALDRSRSSSEVATPAPSLDAPEARVFIDLAFPVKQNVMREQAKYKCLEFAALQRRGGHGKATVLDAGLPSVRFAL